MWDARVDIRDMWSRRETVRRVAVIASQLPPGSRCAEALLEDDMWNRENYQLANVIDGLQSVAWHITSKGVETRNQPPQPEPMSRPKDLRTDKERDSKRLKMARAFKARKPQRRQ